MRWLRITTMWRLLGGLVHPLPLFFLMIGSLIAISITSGMLAITIIMLLNKKAWLPLGPTFIVLGVEVLILVISQVMLWYVSASAWKPY